MFRYFPDHERENLSPLWAPRKLAQEVIPAVDGRRDGCYGSDDFLSIAVLLRQRDVDAA
jgi:hypothetical protein